MFGNNNTVKWYTDGIFMVLDNGNYLVANAITNRDDTSISAKREERSMSFVSDRALERLGVFCEIKPAQLLIGPSERKSSCIEKYYLKYLKEVYYKPEFEKLNKPKEVRCFFGEEYGGGRNFLFNYIVKSVQVKLTFTNKILKGNLYPIINETRDSLGNKIGKYGGIFAKPVKVLGRNDVVPYFAPDNYSILMSWKSYFDDVDVIEDISDEELIYG